MGPFDWLCSGAPFCDTPPPPCPPPPPPAGPVPRRPRPRCLRCLRPLRSNRSPRSPRSRSPRSPRSRRGCPPPSRVTGALPLSPPPSPSLPPPPPPPPSLSPRVSSMADRGSLLSPERSGRPPRSPSSRESAPASSRGRSASAGARPSGVPLSRYGLSSELSIVGRLVSRPRPDLPRPERPRRGRSFIQRGVNECSTAYDAHDGRGHALDGFVRGYACVVTRPQRGILTRLGRDALSGDLLAVLAPESRSAPRGGGTSACSAGRTETTGRAGGRLSIASEAHPRNPDVGGTPFGCRDRYASSMPGIPISLHHAHPLGAGTGRPLPLREGQ